MRGQIWSVQFSKAMHSLFYQNQTKTCGVILLLWGSFYCENSYFRPCCLFSKQFNCINPNQTVMKFKKMMMNLTVYKRIILNWITVRSPSLYHMILISAMTSTSPSSRVRQGSQRWSWCWSPQCQSCWSQQTLRWESLRRPPRRCPLIHPNTRDSATDRKISSGSFQRYCSQPLQN